MNIDEQAQAWVYYQNLVREAGFDGVTDLLVKQQEAQDEIEHLTQWLDRLLYTVPGDHMTHCDRTMGDSHPCTCGATEIAIARSHKELKQPVP